MLYVEFNLKTVYLEGRSGSSFLSSNCGAVFFTHSLITQEIPPPAPPWEFPVMTSLKDGVCAPEDRCGVGIPGDEPVAENSPPWLPPPAPEHQTKPSRVLLFLTNNTEVNVFLPLFLCANQNVVTNECSINKCRDYLQILVG